MNTRIGKIAQLPKEIREELNRRLEDGKQGPELLRWLNDLPETRELLAAKFENKPITKSNLSDWRAGGYEDWKRNEAREERIRNISDSGNALAQFEKGDLFENFARMAVAELAADMDALDGMKDRDARWQRLRELCHELARLQNGFNRSRWAELAWTKWNDRFLNPNSIQTPFPNPNPAGVVPGRAKSHETQVRFVHLAHCGCVCRKCHPENGPYPYWDAERDLAARKSSELVQTKDGESFYLHYWPCDCTCKRCDSKDSGPEADGKPRKSLFRIVSHTKCKCGGVCKKCHSLDSKYPITEVIRDIALVHEHNSSTIRGTDGTSTCVRSSLCQCACDECERNQLDPTSTTLTT